MERCVAGDQKSKPPFSRVHILNNWSPRILGLCARKKKWEKPDACDISSAGRWSWCVAGDHECSLTTPPLAGRCHSGAELSGNCAISSLAVWRSSQTDPGIL
jgi:hypothetical protein